MLEGKKDKDTQNNLNNNFDIQIQVIGEGFPGLKLSV